MLPQPYQRNLAIGVVVLLLLHLAITVPFALTLNVWTDEASTLYATQNGFWVAFQTAAAEQKQAPLYFWIMSLWRMADDSLFFARLFSIVCSLGAIVVFHRLATRFFKPVAALAATAFIALHPFLIWASVEVRVYSLVVLLSVVLIRLFLDAFFDDDGSPNRYWKSVWFLVFAIISLYTNYYLGFLLAGLFFALIVTGKWRSAIRYAGLMVVAGAAFLPLVLTAAAELRSRSAGSIEEYSLIDGVKVVWNHLLTFLLPTEIFPPEQQSIASMVRAWIARFGLAVIAILAIWKRKDITAPTIAFAVVAAAIGFCMIVAGSLVGPSLIVIRHAAMLYVTVVLPLALLIRDISVGWRVNNIFLAGAVPLIIASFGYGISHIYPEHTKRGDWARVAAFIEQNESAGQPILVFPTFDALSPRSHYKGVNQILPDEKYFDFIPGANVRSPEDLRREIEFAISELPPGSDRIWLAVGDLCNGNDGCSPLQNYIDANYTKEIEKDFYLEKLYLLKKRPQ